MQKQKAIIFILSLLNFSTVQSLENNKIELPDMGDSSGVLISADEEKKLGEAFFRSLHSQIEINQDPEIQQYIQTVGQKLVAHSDSPSYPFHFFVVMENNVNAFAGPGGYIGVNSGLILTTDAESELASVMAHEIAHVTQRHLYRAYEAGSRLSIPMAAATLAAILLGSQSPAAGQAAIMAIQAGSVQFQIDFTRENEEEADRIGMQTLSKSEFDPRSMPTFFERLQQATRYYGQNVPEFLRTHPVTTSRISDSRGRADTYPYKQYPDSLNYQLIKTKMYVLSTQDINQIKLYFQTRLTQGMSEQRIVAKYGLGLVALKEQNFQEAERIFQELVKTFPEQSHYAIALARTALENNHFEIALSRYKQFLTHFPDYEAIKLEYINVLLKTGDLQTAKTLAFSLSNTIQKLPQYWELLAQIYGKLNQAAESHRYLAEYYYHIGQLREAILQIELAQRMPNLSFQLTSILNERLMFFINEEQESRRAH